MPSSVGPATARSPVPAPFPHRPTTSSPRPAPPRYTRKEREFEHFLLLHMPMFRRHAARGLHGSSEVDDALQRGLIRMWSGWEHWPADPLARRAYALHTLADAVRNQVWDAR